MTTEELSRAIGYMEYPDPSPRKEPIACVVSHPDALQELTESANNEIEILQGAEAHRFDLNPAVRAALGSASISEAAYDEAYERAASAAYPPEELADNIDPGILRFEYGDYGMSVPPDW
jgi:hypothetical protein